MTPDDLKTWRAAMGLKTQAEAAALLGYGRQHYSDMERGKQPLPEHLALLCAAHWYQIAPWPICVERQLCNGTIPKS